MKKIVAILAVAALAMSAAFSAKAIEDPNPVGTKVVGVQAGFLPGFPHSGLRIGLVHFHQSADQAPLPVVRAPLEQNLSVFFNNRTGTVEDQLPGAGEFPKIVNVIQ